MTKTITGPASALLYGEGGPPASARRLSDSEVAALEKGARLGAQIDRSLARHLRRDHSGRLEEALKAFRCHLVGARRLGLSLARAIPDMTERLPLLDQTLRQCLLERGEDFERSDYDRALAELWFDRLWDPEREDAGGYVDDRKIGQAIAARDDDLVLGSDYFLRARLDLIDGVGGLIFVGSAWVETWAEQGGFKEAFPVIAQANRRLGGDLGRPGNALLRGALEQGRRYMAEKLSEPSFTIDSAGLAEDELLKLICADVADELDWPGCEALIEATLLGHHTDSVALADLIDKHLAEPRS